MSYVIVYDRQVIKTPTGYTLVVLHGDNNLWEPNNKRRVRSWNCWLLNQSEEAFDRYFQQWIGEKDREHFRCHGKWICDAGLKRWYKNGLKKAKTVEEFAAYTGSIRCSVIAYDGDSRSEILYGYVRTTEEFLDWISKVEEYKNVVNENIYVCISFGGTEPLRLPDTGKDLQGKVYVTYQNRYLYEVDDRGQTFGPEADKALIFHSAEEAKNNVPSLLCNKSYRLHDAEQLQKRLQQQQYVIAFTVNGHTRYLSKKIKNGYQTVVSDDLAQHMTSKEAEKKAAGICLANKAIVVSVQYRPRKPIQI